MQNLDIDYQKVIAEENDVGLGSGNLGRLAACMLDSLATLNLPAWGYGILYKFGCFKQVIVKGQQIELPDYWIGENNPWMIRCNEVSYRVRFGGHVRTERIAGRSKFYWEGGETVMAKAVDVPLPGFRVKNMINLRLWDSIPDEVFNVSRFNEGDYYDSLKPKQDALLITSTFYQTDSSEIGKELKLK